jgi:uncharacterized protein DUF6665
MMVRPLRPVVSRIWTDNPAAALDYEIAQEKASTLGRLSRALEAALAALRDHDAQTGEHSAEARQTRGVLVAEASRALWHFIVQREALGLRDSRQVMRDYRVPGEVQNRMGALPHRANRA